MKQIVLHSLFFAFTIWHLRVQIVIDIKVEMRWNEIA